MYAPEVQRTAVHFRPKQGGHFEPACRCPPWQAGGARNLSFFLLHFEKAAKSFLEIACSHCSFFFNKELWSSSGGLVASSLGSSSASSLVGSPESSRVDAASAASPTSSSA